MNIDYGGLVDNYERSLLDRGRRGWMYLLDRLGHMVLKLPPSYVSPPLFVCLFVWSLWFISPCRFLWLVSPFIEFLSKVWDWGGWGWVSVRSWPDKQTRILGCNLGCLFELFVGTLRFFSLLDFCPKRDMCGSSYMLVQIISILIFFFLSQKGWF